MSHDIKRIRNILVATDFSRNADFAILRALSIAKKFSANVTLLHIIQNKPIDNFLDNTFKRILPKGLFLTTKEYKYEMLQEKIQPLLKQNLAIESFVVPKGNPAKKILRFAKKQNIDLLITGAHGRYSIRDTFVGTTAEYIAKHTTCPVLIVKNQPKNSYQRILVPTDFSSVNKKALNYALKLFPNSTLRLLHVGDYEYEVILKEKLKKEIGKNKLTQIKNAIFLYLDNKIKKFIKGKKINKYSYNITLGYPGPIIVSEAKKLKQDLVVMGTQGHGRIHYLFIGNVANWVLTEVNSDVLLVPP